MPGENVFGVLLGSAGHFCVPADASRARQLGAPDRLSLNPSRSGPLIAHAGTVCHPYWKAASRSIGSLTGGTISSCRLKLLTFSVGQEGECQQTFAARCASADGSTRWKPVTRPCQLLHQLTTTAATGALPGLCDTTLNSQSFGHPTCCQHELPADCGSCTCGMQHACSAASTSCSFPSQAI